MRVYINLIYIGLRLRYELFAYFCSPVQRLPAAVCTMRHLAPSYLIAPLRAGFDLTTP